jgi:hypothetical protein
VGSDAASRLDGQGRREEDEDEETRDGDHHDHPRQDGGKAANVPSHGRNDAEPRPDVASLADVFTIERLFYTCRPSSPPEAGPTP